MHATGELVEIVQIWKGQVWAITPSVVVGDDADLTALYVPSGTTVRSSTSRGIADREGLPRQERLLLSLESGIWNLEEKQQVLPLLLLMLPGHWWGVTLAWLPDGGVFGWKIDAQEPLRRTETGFETMDLILDAIVEPDLSGWTMKDIAELDAASERGILSPEEVRQVRGGMEDALRRLQARSSPFDPSWAAWKPDGTVRAG